MSNQIGVNTWTWVSPLKTSDCSTLIPKVKQMGFDVVELPLEDISLLDAGAIRGMLEDSGLGVTVCGAFGPSRDLSSDDPAIVGQALDYIRESLDFCQTVGAEVYAGPIYAAVGKARHLPADERKAEFQRAVNGLGKAAALAQDRGVRLAIEPLNRFETDVINTAKQAREAVDRVSHPALGIHLDTFHMNIEEDSVYDAVLTAGDKLFHVHASESNRGTPGKGLADWQQLGRGLREAKYNGPIVIETFTPDVKEIARAAAIWRPLAPSQDYIATEGLRFLRGLL